MDGSFNYMQKLGEKLSAKPRVEEQPADEDIANALQIMGDPRLTRIDVYDSLRVVELLNSALEKMRRPRCMICDQRVAKDVIADDGVCFECRNPECEPGEQVDRPSPLQRGVLRVLRGYGESTLTQVLNRVLPVHNTAQEGHIARALEQLIDAKLVKKVGSRYYDITELGLTTLRHLTTGASKTIKH